MDLFKKIRTLTINFLRKHKIFNPFVKSFHENKQRVEFSLEFKQFTSMSTSLGRVDIGIDKKDLYPILNERTSTTDFDRHYIYHTGWAARVLNQLKPDFHIDISSSLYFVSIASADVPIRFYDFRPPDLQLSGVSTGQADLTKLDFDDTSLKSLSCMHVLEHIGLGRYGDPIDPNGDLKAINELVRILAVNGHLLIVVPIGAARVCFNAHRIYDPVQFRSYFSGLEMVEFACVPDGGHLLRNASPSDFRKEKYACGMYHFLRPV